MKKLNCLCCCFVAFCVVVSLTGCEGGGSGHKHTYFLVNNTGNILHYKTYRNDLTSYFDTTLFPSDTLPLYSETFTHPGPLVREYLPFYGSIIVQNASYADLYYYGTLMIEDENEKVLFYRSKDMECGNVSVESKKIGSDNYYHYWIIDSTYIADKSCNMSWEDFEREYLNAE